MQEILNSPVLRHINRRNINGNLEKYKKGERIESEKKHEKKKTKKETDRMEQIENLISLSLFPTTSYYNTGIFAFCAPRYQRALISHLSSPPKNYSPNQKTWKHTSFLNTYSCIKESSFNKLKYFYNLRVSS